MSDPLSITASIVSVTVPALHGMRLLSHDLNQIIEAPRSIQLLRDDVSSAEMAVQTLQDIKDTEWEVLGDSIAEQSKAAIEHCAKACVSFRNDLQRWTKHSQGGRLSWRDRAKVGFFKEYQVEAVSEHLQSCKTTFNSAVGVATLYSSLRHARTTEETKTTIITRETELSEAIQSTDKKLAEIIKVLGNVYVTDPTNEADQNEEDKVSALKQVQEERAALDRSRALLEELLSKQREVIAEARENQGRVTSVKFGNNNKGFQTGVINGSFSNMRFGVD